MTDNSSNNGVGVLGILGIVFVVLKLTHVIAWSWWWVLAPFWGGFLFVFVLGCLLMILQAVADQ